MQNLLSLVLSPQELLLETILERRTGLEREGIKSSKDFFGKVSHGTEILLYARFGGGKFLVAGEDDVTVQDVLFVEEVVGIVRVVEIVEFENIVLQGSMLWSAVLMAEEVVEEEVVEEEVVEEVIAKEVGMVTAVELVEEEVFGEKLEGPSRGSSEHIFLVVPSPLLLLFYRFVAVSIGVSCDSGVVGTGVVLAFFLALVAGGCSVM